LRLVKNENFFFPWKLDYSPAPGFPNSNGNNVVDNMEGVKFAVPASGVYSLTVNHKATL
jgi:hypothetical protein